MTISLLADIGGTHARFAIFEIEKRQWLKQQTLLCADFENIYEIIAAFISSCDFKIQAAVLAVATPITSDVIKMTNLSWHFSITQLQQYFSWKNLYVINDFTAQAFAIPPLTEKDLICVQRQIAIDNAPIAVIGAGTGLGTSALIPNANGWHCLSSEGGHRSFAAQNEQQWFIWQFASNNGKTHLSAERLLSGSGLELIDRALAKLYNYEHRARNASEITAQALNGDIISKKTLDTFCAILANVSSDLVLTIGARGGLYICGGIVPRFANYLINESPFIEQFNAKGRLSYYLHKIPIYIVIKDNPGLLGAAQFIMQQHHE